MSVDHCDYKSSQTNACTKFNFKFHEFAIHPTASTLNSWYFIYNHKCEPNGGGRGIVMGWLILWEPYLSNISSRCWNNLTREGNCWPTGGTKGKPLWLILNDHECQRKNLIAIHQISVDTLQKNIIFNFVVFLTLGERKIQGSHYDSSSGTMNICTKFAI